MTPWCLTTSPENIAKTAELGWKLQGIKSRRGPTARKIRPGDRLVYYITGVAAFAAIAEIRSEYFEDHEPIWRGKPGEDYPWRFEIAAEVILDDQSLWVPAVELHDDLEFCRKWPRENWTLAFQGNIRPWPDHDYELVKAALEGAAAGARR